MFWIKKCHACKIKPRLDMAPQGYILFCMSCLRAVSHESVFKVFRAWNKQQKEGSESWPARY